MVKASRRRRDWAHIENDNSVRRRPAIGRHMPREAFEARIKADPPKPGVFVEGYRIRHDKVDATGKVALRYRGRLYHLGIGRAYKGRRVVLMVAGPQVRLLDADHRLIREFTIDPARKYQGQG
jgi:hypothetical protein